MSGKKDKKTKTIDAYLDYLLTEGKRPASVYSFAKMQKMQEAEFYAHFASFDELEAVIWKSDLQEAISTVKDQDLWKGYSAREKMLAFFFTYVEILKGRRSFLVQTLKYGQPMDVFQRQTPMKGLKSEFKTFCTEILEEGIKQGELRDRKGLSGRYSDALWIQFRFILDFWIKDNSPSFEKTDAAIEKSMHLSFDLFGSNPLDSMLDFGKFLFQNTFSSQDERTK